MQIMESLAEPNVLRCFCDATLAPTISALELRWPADAAERIWHLPQAVSILSAAPTRFGIVVERLGADAFKVQLLWNHTHFSWNPVRRVDVMTSSLSLILKALGTDLWQLLQQPVADSLAA
jgi:hypothetical protein